MSPPPAAPLLTVRGLQKSFGATAALRGVDFTVEAGSVHALIGENGAGKSTLIRILAGADSAEAGEITFDGKPYRPADTLAARSLGVCTIYQDLALAPHLTVMENVLLGIEPTWLGGVVDWEAMRDIAARSLSEVGHSEIHPEDVVGDLSLAEQQLVEIARAVAAGCRLLVLDEPTSALPLDDVKKLFTLVRRLQGKGVAVIYISHTLEEVQRLCDRFTVLRDGVTVGGGRVADTPAERMVAMMVGGDVDNLYPHTARTPGETLLEVTDLSAERTPRHASLTLHRREVMGIVGVTGSGRTELLRTIFGLKALRAGSIKLKTFVGAASPAQQWKHGMGMVSEDRKDEGLALSMSIADNLSLTRMGFFVDPKLQDVSAESWIKRLRVRCNGPRQDIGDLSGGNQQKVAIARLLEHGVDVLLLDEPTRGIDVGSKAQIYRLIDDLACKGKGVLVVSSYPPELLGICDRIAVMNRGVLGEARPASAWDEHSLMMTATGQREG